jgi:hypothetical protein
MRTLGAPISFQTATFSATTSPPYVAGDLNVTIQWAIDCMSAHYIELPAGYQTNLPAGLDQGEATALDTALGDL